MYAKPLIGISLEADSRDCADSRRICPTVCRWIEVVTRAGGIPLVVPPLEDETDAGHVMDHLRAVISVGVTDYERPSDQPPWDAGPRLRWSGQVGRRCTEFRRGGDTAMPGERPLTATAEFCTSAPLAAACRAGLLLIRAAAQRHVPFLGIGRGLQLLNVALGGRLGRVDAQARRRVPAYPHNPLHALYTLPGSRVARVFGDGVSLINSPLQWTVAEVAPELTVTGWRRDKTVEAVESASADWPAVAVRFQPDSLGTRELDVTLCEVFLEEVAEREPVAAASRAW